VDDELGKGGICQLRDDLTRVEAPTKKKRRDRPVQASQTERVGHMKGKKKGKYACYKQRHSQSHLFLQAVKVYTHGVNLSCYIENDRAYKKGSFLSLSEKIEVINS